MGFGLEEGGAAGDECAKAAEACDEAAQARPGEHGTGVREAAGVELALRLGHRCGGAEEEAGDIEVEAEAGEGEQCADEQQYLAAARRLHKGGGGGVG